MNPYPPTDPSSNTPASPSAPPAGYGPPVGTVIPPMAPVPPAPQLARNATASMGIRLTLTAAVLIIVVFIAAATLPASLVATRMAAFPIPIVSIQSSPTETVGTGQKVTFTAQRIAGNQLAYAWTFQDGEGGATTATGPSTTQSFSNFGDISVTLTANDPMGHSAHANTILHVLPPPPVASFTYSTPNASSSACYIGFDASESSSQSGIANYFWNFGDDGGPIDAGPVPSHRYNRSGSYTVTLTVADQYNQQSSTQQTINLSC